MAINRPRNNKGQFTTNNGTWFKNAAKSLGYAGIDMLKETMPAVMETIDINKEFVTDIGSTLRNIRYNKTGKFNIKYHLTGKALENWNDAEDYARNALSDLKTGQFYNKERIQHTADDFGLEDFDFDDMSFDVSDDFDDSNFDDDVKVVVPNVTINSNIDKNNPMVKVVQQQSKLMADVEAAATKRDIKIAESQMKLDKQLAGVLYGGMETINNNLSTLINFNNEHTSGYIGASLKYYEENIRYMADISESLKKIGGLIEKEETPANEHVLDQITTYGGAVNLSGYLKVVKKQLRNAIDEDMLLGSVMAMLESDGIKALAQSPLTFIPQMILTKMVPDFLTKTFKSFDDSFKAFVPALLNKMGSWADEASTDLMSAFKGFIGSVFGIKNTGKTSIEPSAYEKGVVPFDGVTRKSIVEVIPGYLSKILSALTGKEELIFDSDKGKFITRSALKTEYDEQVKRAATSGFESYDEIKSRIKAFGLRSDEAAQLEKDIDKLFIELSKRKKSFNPHIIDGRDDLAEILGADISTKELTAIRSLILSLDRSQIQDLAGRGHINARRNLNKLMEEYEKSGNMVGMAQVNGLFGADADYLENNPLIKSTQIYPSNNSKDSKIVGSIFTPSDRYGKNSLDYLHDIYKTLLEGIGVWFVDPNNNRLSELNTFESENDRSISRYSNNNPISENLTNEDIASNAEQGIQNYQYISNIIGNEKVLVEEIKNHLNQRDGNITSEQKQPSHFRNLVKFLFGTNEEKQQIVSDTVGGWRTNLKNKFVSIDEAMYKLVFGTNSIDYVGGNKEGLLSSMASKFKVWLFGEKDEEGKSIGGIFNRFHTFLTDKIYNPIKEAFIGKDGIITKFKQSEFYKNIINSIKKTSGKLFGEKVDGKRVGGKFSEWANKADAFIGNTKLSDIRYNATTGYYINNKTNEVITDQRLIDQLEGYRRNFKWDENVAKGKRINDGVIGNIKNIGSDFKNSLKEWLFGSDPNKTKEDAKGLLSGVAEYFKQGMQGFTDLIFGQNNARDIKDRENDIKFDDILNKIKERAPKMVASGIVGGGLGAISGAGGFGILGSLFLGPMSGVVIGAASGLLSQSETFKNWLFGEKDDNGNRIGGIISKSTQNFFKKHKGAIIGGTALGALKGITGVGFLPSFILGGPITGALFGLGTSLITKSQMFQDMLFGKDDGEGNRAGGVVSKITGKLNNDGIQKSLGFAGAGATIGAITGTALSSFGILGSIAFGPLSGAILGAGAGIALAANRWKDAIFGKFDERTGKKTQQGILSKMMTAVSVEVLQPAKVQITEWKYNVQDWFAEHIAEPFLDSIDPLKEEVKRFKERIVDFGKAILDKLHITELFESIGNDIKEGFSTISKFMIDITKGAIRGIGKFTGFVISSPFKLINMVAEKILLPKHMREGIKAVRDKIIDNIKESKFVKSVNTHVIEPIKGTILEVRDFTKNIISNMFSWIWTGIKNIGQGLFNTITAPFKGIAAIGRGVGSLLNKGTRTGYRDTDRWSAIMNSNGEERGFGQSIGDLLSLANPFSSLRRAAKFSKDGAGYQDERLAKREQRKLEREEKRKQHEAEIEEMRRLVKSSRTQARALGYNIVTDDEKEATNITKRLNKIIDKEYTDQYGNEYKNKSKIEKDAFKETKAVNKSIFDIKDLVSKGISMIGRFFTEGIKINNKKSSNKSDNPINPESDSNETGLSVLTNNKEKKSTKYKKGSVFESLAEKKAEEERLKQQGLFHKIANLLETGNKDRKEHSSVWSSIFSKKGLITGGLLILAPLLYKFLTNGFNINISNMISNGFDELVNKLKELFGIKDDNGDRTDASGDTQTNDNVIEASIIGGAKVGAKAIQGVAKANQTIAKFTGNGVKKVGGVIDNIGSGVKNVFNKISGKTATSVSDDSVKYAKNAAGRWYDKTTGKFVKAEVAEAAMKQSDEAVETTAKSGVITKFISLLDDGIKKLSQWLTKKFPNFGKSKAGQVLITAISKISKAGGKLISFVDDILKGFNKIAASTTTGYILDAGFVIYGGVTGATKAETANVFGVSQNAVDSYMQAASGLLKALLSFSWFFVITIASDISVAMGGANIIRLLAQTIYSLLIGGDADKVEALMKAQTQFDTDYEKYIGVQEYLKGNAELSTDGKIIINDPSKVESKDSYNDRVNKGVFGTAKDWVGNKWTNIKTFFKGQEGDSAAYNEAQKQLQQLNQLVADGLIKETDPAYIQTKKSLEEQLAKTQTKGNGLQEFGKKVKNKVTDIFKPVIDTVSPYFNAGKELLTYIKDTAITSIQQAFDNNKTNDNLKIDKDDPLASIKKVLFYGIKTSLLPVYMPLKLIDYAWDKIIKPTGEGIMNLGKAFVQDSVSMSQSIKSGSGIFTKSYWTAPNNGDNTTSGLRKVGFYAQRILSAPTGLIGTVAQYAWDKVIKPTGEGIITLGKGYLEDSVSMSQAIKSGSGIFTKAYWTAPNNGDNTTSGLRKAGFYAQRILSAPTGLIGTVAQYAWDKVIKPAGEGIMNLNKAFTEDTKSMNSSIKSGSGIFTKAYWTAPNNGDNTTSGLRKAGFYAQRILSTPIGIVGTVGKAATDVMSDIWGGITQFSSFMNTVLNTDTLTPDNYWTHNKPTGTGMMDTMKKVLFYIGRGIAAPGFYLKNALSIIGDKLKETFGSVADWFSDLFDIARYFGSDDDSGDKQWWKFWGGPLPDKNGIIHDQNISMYGIGGPTETGMLDKYRVTSQYNEYRGISQKTGKAIYHKGLDLVSSKNAPILSFTDGTVDYVTSGYRPDSGYYGSSDGGGYGNWVRVKDSNGNLHMYAHMNKTSVTRGQKVSQGTQLGLEGHTGSSTGAHLHYEVTKNGVAVNPRDYLSSYISPSSSQNIINSDNNPNTNIDVSPEEIESAGQELTGLAGVTAKLTSAFTEMISPITSVASALSTSFSNLLGLSTDTNSNSSTNIQIDNANSSSSGSTGNNMSTPTGSTSGGATTIWKTLRSLGFNKIATAALMGNFDAESALKSNNLQDEYESALGYNDDSYTRAVDNGSYTLNRFMNDQAGYGLAQWTHYSRKQGLYNYAKSNNKSISDLGMQLSYVPRELGSSGINRLNNFSDITSASNYVLRDYERPADQSQAAANKRASFSKKYYDTFANSIGGQFGIMPQTNPIDTNKFNLFNTSNYNSNVNSNISRILQSANTNNSNISSSVIEYLKKIADGIISIVNNTSDTNTKLDEIKDIESEKENNTNNVAVVPVSDNKSNSPMYDIASNRRANTKNKGYQTAKAIAAGGI